MPKRLSVYCSRLCEPPYSERLETMCEPAAAIVATARCSAAWPLAVAIAPMPPFERSDALFQHGVGRIGDARVHVPGALHVEQRRGVVGVAEHERGRLVDRRRARARGGVGLLAGVQAQRVEAQVAGRGHGLSPDGCAARAGV